MALMHEGVVREERAKDRNPMMNGRVYRKAKDQHGRTWGAEIDKRTDQPCGPLRAYFDAPWMPDAQYVHWRIDEDTTLPSVFIDYPEMKGDRRMAAKEWEKRFMQIGVTLDGQRFDPSQPSLSVQQAAGPRPAPVEVAIAAERNDPWLLGFTADMPHFLEPYFAHLNDDEAAFMYEPEPATGAADDDEAPAAPPKARRGKAA